MGPDRRDDDGAFDRRRLLALLGSGLVVGGGIGALRALDGGGSDTPGDVVRAGQSGTPDRLDRGATATEPAVRLDPPDPPVPPGGFDPGNLYVALYGHPGSSVLGVLGEQPVVAAADRAEAVAAQYTGFGSPVVATFELIVTVASSQRGADGDYSNEFADSKFTPWIEEAERRGMHVLCDLQPGRATFPSQAQEIEALLRYRNVSLALDPEWRVGPNQRPGGGRIGTVDAAEINRTIAWLDDLVRRHRLPPKMLVVHQFTPSMVTNKQAIRGTDRVTVVFQMDGFGSLSLKLGSWDRMVSDLPAGALTGWKNFYDEDRPTPTPAETMAVTPTPVYVSYQ